MIHFPFYSLHLLRLIILHTQVLTHSFILSSSSLSLLFSLSLSLTQCVSYTLFPFSSLHQMDSNDGVMIQSSQSSLSLSLSPSLCFILPHSPNLSLSSLSSLSLSLTCPKPRNGSKSTPQKLESFTVMLIFFVQFLLHQNFSICSMSRTWVILLFFGSYSFSSGLFRSLLN